MDMGKEQQLFVAFFISSVCLSTSRMWKQCDGVRTIGEAGRAGLLGFHQPAPGRDEEMQAKASTRALSVHCRVL